MPSKTRRQWIVGGRIDDGDDEDDDEDDDDDDNWIGLLSWVMARVLIESRESLLTNVTACKPNIRLYDVNRKCQVT